MSKSSKKRPQETAQSPPRVLDRASAAAIGTSLAPEHGKDAQELKKEPRKKPHKDITHARYTVFCCQGGDCTKHGAGNVLKALRHEVRVEGLKHDVHFIKTYRTRMLTRTLTTASPISLGSGGFCIGRWWGGLVYSPARGRYV